MIALALAGDPDLLVADEPTTVLDSEVADQIIALLSDLQERRNLAILFISHDRALVEHFCDRVLVMNGGQLAEDGTTMCATRPTRGASTVYETAYIKRHSKA